MQAELTLHAHIVNKTFRGIKKLQEMYNMVDQRGTESVSSN
jgi:hypothetical protein